MENEADAILTVEVENNAVLVIRIGINALAYAIQHAPEMEAFDEEEAEILTPTVTDPVVFAKAVVNALRSEEEDGTTPVHRMLDAAATEACEQGAEGIETGWDKLEELRRIRALSPSATNVDSDGER